MLRRSVLGLLLLALVVGLYASADLEHPRVLDRSMLRDVSKDTIATDVVIYRLNYEDTLEGEGVGAEVWTLGPTQTRHIAVDATGNNVCAMYMPEDQDEHYPEVWYFYSEDGGATWNGPVVIVPPSISARGYACLDMDSWNAPYVGFVNRPTDGSGIWVYYSFATVFDGSDFSAPAKMTPDTSGGYMPGLQVVGDGANQALLMYSVWGPEGVIARYSTDYGTSWLPDPFNVLLEVDGENFYDVNQPAVAGTDDGYMCAIICAAPDTNWPSLYPSVYPYATFPYFVESTDYGQTWSTPEPIFNDGAGNPVRPEGGTGGTWWSTAGTMGILSDGTPVFAVVMEATYDTAWNAENCRTIDTTVTTVDSAGIVSVDTTIDTLDYVGDYVFTGIRNADGTWSTQIVNPIVFERTYDADTTVEVDTTTGDTITTINEYYYGMPGYGAAWYVSLATDDNGNAVVYWIDGPYQWWYGDWCTICYATYMGGTWSSPAVLKEACATKIHTAEKAVDGDAYILYSDGAYAYFLKHQDVLVGIETARANRVANVELVSFPNPVRSSATISFTIPSASNVELKVYDASGRCVRTLVDGNLSAGAHTVTWDARDDMGKPVANGVYFYRLATGSASASGKMVVVR